MKTIAGIFGLVFKVYVACVFSLTLLIYYLPIVVLKSFPQTKKKTFVVFCIWSWTFRILTFIHVRRMQQAKVPKGPYIIVSNHASYLDIFLMHSIMPQHPFLFLGKSEILCYPLMKSFFKNLNIPVFRKDRIKAAKSFVKARNAIEEGWSLIIFPEGGIPDDKHPAMVPFKDGAFKLAKSCKVPLVPLTFTNNHLLFSDPGDLLGRAHPGISRVYMHPTISVEEVESKSISDLSDYVFDVINGPLQALNKR